MSFSYSYRITAISNQKVEKVWKDKNQLFSNYSYAILWRYALEKKKIAHCGSTYIVFNSIWREDLYHKKYIIKIKQCLKFQCSETFMNDDAEHSKSVVWR